NTLPPAYASVRTNPTSRAWLRGTPRDWPRLNRRQNKHRRPSPTQETYRKTGENGAFLARSHMKRGSYWSYTNRVPRVLPRIRVRISMSNRRLSICLLAPLPETYTYL